MQSGLKSIAKNLITASGQALRGKAKPASVDSLEKYRKDVVTWKYPYSAWKEEMKKAPKEDRSFLCDDKKTDVTDGRTSAFFVWGYEDDSLALRDALYDSGYEYVVLTYGKESLKPGWMEEVLAYCSKHPKTALLYADEDVEGDDTVLPYFKPEDSPETLDSFFYYGGFIVLRRARILRFLKERVAMPDADKGMLLGLHGAELAYAISYLFRGQLSTEEVGHINKILVSRKDAEFPYLAGFLQEHLFTQHHFNLTVKSEDSVDRHKVSIVILTKDHPQILETCVSSIRNKTQGVLYEILVVDNGSNADGKLQNEQLAQKYQFGYFYEPCEFNFSKLCNYGVSKAEGDYILLLNDDTEVITELWLKNMMDIAVKHDVGAVGAKLYYAGTNKLQHIGVTQLKVGPSHKLVKCPDDRDYYYGVNRYNHNVLAVTGACLLVRKALYEKAGGLREDFRVAYNDIDFCMTLEEMGYRNVCCMDACLYHYESMTRGQDEEDGEKWERLLSEKEHLYQRHPRFVEWDPYYSAWLLDNSADYAVNYKNVEQDMELFSKIKRVSKEKASTLLHRGNKFWVKARLDMLAFQRRWGRLQKDMIRMEGWGCVRGKDNASYSPKMILVGKSLDVSPEKTETFYEVEAFKVYRPDVAEYLVGEIHTELSGFFVRIDPQELPAADYEMWMVYAREDGDAFSSKLQGGFRIEISGDSGIAVRSYL